MAQGLFSMLSPLDPSLEEIRHAAWLTIKWLLYGGIGWAGWRWLVQPVFDVQVNASRERQHKTFDAAVLGSIDAQKEKFAKAVHAALDGDRERTDARMLSSVERNGAAWAQKLETYVYADHLASRGVLETQVGELRERTAGNTRSLESVQGELAAHTQALRDVPDMSRTMKHLTETLQRIDDAQQKRDERQQEYALKITGELARLSGVVQRLATEWDGRDRRDPSQQNATRRAHFPEEG